MGEDTKELAQQLEALETEHKVLSARFDLLSAFTMNIVHLLAEDQDREALREGIKRLIRQSKTSCQLDLLNDAQDLLRAFEVVMPPPGT